MMPHPDSPTRCVFVYGTLRRGGRNDIACFQPAPQHGAVGARFHDRRVRFASRHGIVLRCNNFSRYKKIYFALRNMEISD
jgi:hypothetical protein